MSSARSLLSIIKNSWRSRERRRQSSLLHSSSSSSRSSRYPCRHSSNGQLRRSKCSLSRSMQHRRLIVSSKAHQFKLFLIKLWLISPRNRRQQVDFTQQQQRLLTMEVSSRSLTLLGAVVNSSSLLSLVPLLRRMRRKTCTMIRLQLLYLHQMLNVKVKMKVEGKW